MECPVCNCPVRQEEQGGALRVWCSSCGWGTETAQVDEVSLPVEKASVGQLMLWWAGALLVVVGPYFALRYGLPSLFDIGLSGAEEAYARYLAVLNSWYALVMALYLGAAGALTPTYDPNNVGWFGGMIDNPFSFQDDFERVKRTLVLVLLPGKVFWVAVKLTWSRFRD